MLYIKEGIDVRPPPSYYSYPHLLEHLPSFLKRGLRLHWTRISFIKRLWWSETAWRLWRPLEVDFALCDLYRQRWFSSFETIGQSDDQTVVIIYGVSLLTLYAREFYNHNVFLFFRNACVNRFSLFNYWPSTKWSLLWNRRFKGERVLLLSRSHCE